MEHRFGQTVLLRNQASYSKYDKFYQNVFSGAIRSAGDSVSLAAYSNRTLRDNVFNQADLIVNITTGNVTHTFLTGFEAGRQVTDNFRNTGYFNNTSTSFVTSLENPTVSTPVTFRQSATDADNHGTSTVISAYIQDQVSFTSYLQVVAGVRYDHMNVKLHNNRNDDDFSSNDKRFSPRVGVIVKPVQAVSLYSSYGMTFVPRAGEQLSSLSASNQALDPEVFRNYELGAKWDIHPDFTWTTALYRLSRSNVVVPDPSNPTTSILVDGQRTTGLEVGISGNVSEKWSMLGAYAYQNGVITHDQSATTKKGAFLSGLPKNSVSLWNRYDVTSAVGLALGVSHQGRRFTGLDNTVSLPAYTRTDAAVYYAFSSKVQIQLNVENVLNTKYYLFAHSNNNITPGSPTAFQLQLTMRY